MIHKSMKKLLVGFAVISTASSLLGSSASVSTPATFSTSKGFFQPRPASANLAREMLMEPGAHHRSSDSWYGEFAATGFYQHSWNQANIETATGSAGASVASGSALGSGSVGAQGLGAMPFWSGTNIMTIGNNIDASTTTPSILANVDAYQFGMGPVTPGAIPATIALNPIVYQAGADFMFVVGSSANTPGFFAKIKAPLTVYNINMQLTTPNKITAVPYEQGSLAINNNTTYQPAQTIIQAFEGLDEKNPSSGVQAQGDYKPLRFGLINGDISTGATLGDIEMTMGYSFVSDDDNSFAIGVRAGAPTGNKADGVFMLEPIVGRGGCWGLGGYAAGHVKLWEGNNDNRFSFKFMSDVMHLFITDTIRSYDLIKNGKGSRYLLVANYGSDGITYNNDIENLINFSTLASQSSFGAEGDLAMAFNYAARGWTIDAGYEIFGRSQEKLVITGDFISGRYAVLGRQGVGSTISVTPTPLCQPLATINNSSPRVNAPNGLPGQAAVITVSQATNIQFTDLDVHAAQQDAYISSKVFSKISYEWIKSDYAPFLGVIGEFEWVNSFNNALPQWGIVLVGGVSF